jgi:hypothetical protein
MRNVIQTIGGLLVVICIVTLVIALLNLIWCEKINPIYIQIAATSAIGVGLCRLIEEFLDL